MGRLGALYGTLLSLDVIACFLQLVPIFCIPTTATSITGKPGYFFPYTPTQALERRHKMRFNHWIIHGAWKLDHPPGVPGSQSRVQGVHLAHWDSGSPLHFAFDTKYAEKPALALHSTNKASCPAKAATPSMYRTQLQNPWSMYHFRLANCPTLLGSRNAAPPGHGPPLALFTLTKMSRPLLS